MATTMATGRTNAAETSAEMPREEPRYNFGPLERRGLIAGWRGGQIACVASGLLVAILALRSHPDPTGAVVAFATLIVATTIAVWPISGQTGEEWFPVVARWVCRRVAGHDRWRSRVPYDGLRVGTGASRNRDRRELFGTLHFLDVSTLTTRRGETTEYRIARPPVADTIGVIHDEGARTLTGVLSLSGHGFALLGADERTARVSSWSGLLASLAREGSVVHRLQWIAASLPDDGRAIGGYLAKRAVLTPESGAYRSYADLVELSEAAACTHRVLLAVQVKIDRVTSRAERSNSAGSKARLTNASTVLMRELTNVRRHLEDANVTVEGFLSAQRLTNVFQEIGDPAPSSDGGTRATRTTRANSVRSPALNASAPLLVAMDVGWSNVHLDGVWHATYWIAEWPRVDVDSDFLAPLLLGPVRRSVSVVMEPVSPSRAARAVEQARTADLADSELRRRGGYLATARRSREAQVVARREVELADGHASYRFSGYVTVSAASEELLVDACEATEQDAGQARIELRKLYGDQERALSCALPICGGLS